MSHQIDAFYPDFTKIDPVRIAEPADQRVPFVFSSPHSGRNYPDRFLAMSQLDRHQIRRSEDCFVDQLIEPVVRQGAVMIAAEFPRAYLDVNREPFELDPKMFLGALPEGCNTRSLRVAGGLGTVPRLVGNGLEIYHQRLPVEEAIGRIDHCYTPYHRALRAMLEATRHQFGFAVLIDCHSMPGSNDQQFDMPLADIVLGDRHGHSAARGLVEALRVGFENRGYRVALNRPYAGGFITEHYGAPESHIHAVQIELNRRLYLNEAQYTPNSQFDAVLRDLNGCFAEAMALPDQVFRPFPLAAE